MEVKDEEDEDEDDENEHMESNDDIPNSDQQRDPKDTSNYVSSLRNPSFG